MTYPGQQPPPYQPSGTPPPGYQPPAYPPPAAPTAPPAWAPPAGGQQQFGAPPPAADPMGGFSGPVKGKHLLAACWNLLKQDRSLLMLPVLSAVFAFVALAIFFVPGLVFGFAGGTENSLKFGAYAGMVVGGFAASVVSIFFQAALVIGANERADGGDPTLSSTLEGAWQRKGAILGWAVVTTVVGTIIRAIQQRAGALGSIFGFLGGVAWAIATFLAVPVVVAEGLGPIEAVKRSAALIKQTWGLGLRSTLRFGLVQLLFFVPAVILLVVGIVMIGNGGAARGLGVALLAIALVALVALGVVFGAISQYARAMLYRYATGRPVPGIDPQMMAAAFAPKRDRQRQRYA